MRLTPRGYRHGLRVRMGGVDGPRGVLFRCDKRDGSGVYWKVRLQGVPTRWVWPDGLIVDGVGAALGAVPCASCGLPYLSDGDLICDRCTAEQFGTATARALDADPAPAVNADGDRRWSGRRRSHS